jgi:hypothetical protein
VAYGLLSQVLALGLGCYFCFTTEAGRGARFGVLGAVLASFLLDDPAGLIVRTILCLGVLMYLKVRP